METQTGELKLIYHQGQAVGYARVEDIAADVKPGWWQLRLLVLQVPAREVVWILREEYIDGGEFTMNGEKIFLEPVPPSPKAPVPGPAEDESGPGGDSSGKAKIVSLDSRRQR